MLRAAFKNLLARKLRMFLTGFSIILGVSFVSGTYIFTDSIGSTFDNLFGDVYAGIDVTVRPEQADFGSDRAAFDEAILEQVRGVDGVAIAEPEVSGIAQLLNKEGKLIGGQGAPSLGFSWTEEQSLSALVINEGDGRSPQAANEVVIDKATAEANGFSVGDNIAILLQGPASTFEIVGIATFGEAESLAGATLAAFELKRAQQAFGFEGQYTAINIKADAGTTAEELKERVAGMLPERLEAVTGDQQAAEQLDQISEGLSFINTALLAFAGIAIFVGSFIIQNTFRIIVTQRSKELALLRAMGASKPQVIRLVLYEAFFISLIASGAGILLGLVISSGVRSLMNTIGFSLPDGSLTIAPRTIFVSFAVGIVVTLIAALMPALRASQVSPIEAMRDNEVAQSGRKSLFRRGMIGLVMMAIGAAGLLYGLSGDVSQPLYPVGFGVALLFIGVSVIAPLLSVPLAGVLGWPLVKARGIPARLARDNAKRTPRRTASSAAALMIGVSLVTMLSILATTFKTNITAILDDSFPADLTVLNNNIGEAGPGTAGFPPVVQETLRQQEELTDITAFRYSFEGAKLDGSVIFIAGVDGGGVDKVINLQADEGAFKRMKDEKGIVIRQETLSQNNWQVGQELPIEFASTGKQTIKIVGSFIDPFDTDYLIDTETYLANINNDTITLLAMNAAENTDAAAAKAAAESALEGYPQVTVQDKGDLFETVEQQIDQVLGLFWGLLGFAVIIAVLGITNTLMLSISERTRELGMLRAIGMTRRQTRRMIRYESIIIALFGAVLGIVMGAFFAWAILQALESEGIKGYNISGVQIGIYFLLAIVAGIIAAAWPARKAARMDVLKAIYHE